MTEHSVTPIGKVSKSVADVRDDLWDGVIARIELDAAEFSPECLTGLETFSHVEVLFLLHLVRPGDIERGARHPREREDWPKAGIFAQRGKMRPNRIGATVCRLVGVDGLALMVEGLDAVDGTPVLDIKPYMREFGPRGVVRQPVWASELMSGYWGKGTGGIESKTRLLEQTPNTIRNLLRGTAKEDLDWQPSPDRWSISMVLAHLADVEVHTVHNRIRLVATEDNPVLPAYDQGALFPQGKAFDATAELERFEERRIATLGYLRELPESALQRTGRHEQLGMLRLEEILCECVFHDLGHIRHIVELYRARMLYPRMGPFRNYYQVQP